MRICSRSWWTGFLQVPGLTVMLTLTLMLRLTLT